MQSSRSEEAHWSSFRGEVLQLQKSLVQSLLENNDGSGSSSTEPVNTSSDKFNSQKSNAACDGGQNDSRAAAITGKRIIDSSADENDTATNNYHDMPHSQPPLSPLEEVGDDFVTINNDENEIKNYNTTQTNHQYLELIGMEEVDRNICSVNNKANLSSHDNTTTCNNPTNANAIMSHASQNTNALSIATQELAEMKLKLALTESERDELEFELMQRQQV